MTTSTVALTAVTAAFLIGCGGSSSGNGGGGSASSVASSASSSSSSMTGSSSSAGGSGIDTASLSLNAVEDVYGYTITTNRSTMNAGDQYEFHQRVTLSVDCDGNFDYTITNATQGITVTDHADGTEVTLDTSFNPYELSWYGLWQGGGTFDAGETASDILTLNDMNKIIAGHTCWMDFGDSVSGEDCPNNLYVERITKDETCSNGGSTEGITSLSVSEPADVMGYRLTSVEVDNISKDTIVAEFGCDGSFTQAWTKQYDGLEPNTKMITGDEVYIESVTGLAAEPLTRVRWANGTDQYGQSVNDGWIYLMGDNSQLVTEQSCFNDNCTAGFYLKSIEKIAECH